MIFPCEEDDPVRPKPEESGEEFRDIELECEEEEAREPRVLRDPGAPTEAEVERHNMTHMPFRSWCPACVEGKARDKHHQKSEDQGEKGIPEIVFDYCFLGSEDEETIAIQVARDRRTRMIFAHVVPKKGFSHEHGAAEMIKDIVKLGYNEIILKCDGEPALKTIQEEVQKQRPEKTILENSPVGDSRANGAAERAVQALAEQVRVLRRGLEQRLGLRLSGKHPVTAWLVEHAADVLSKYQVGDDGKTGYERWKGKPYRGEEIEFGEKIHYRENIKARPKQNKLEVRWGEGYYMGRWWRTGEAVVGTAAGILRAGTVRRVGAHRRWDREGLEQVRGLPWQWDPAEGDIHKELKVRWLVEEEIQSGQAKMTEDSCRVYRLRLKKQDFVAHGFTEGCPGCQAIIAGTTAKGHTEACRSRMESALKTTEDGRQRRERQELKENEAFARILQKEDERNAKKAKTADDNQTATSAAAPASRSSSSKRWADADEEEDDNDEFQGPPAKLHRGGEQLENKDKDEVDAGEDMDITNAEENLYQDDMKWIINEVSDMCIPEDPTVRNMMEDMAYFDENTWEILDQRLVEEAETAELARFKQMGVYTYVRRSEAVSDPDGTFVKVKWVRTNKGTVEQPHIKCRLVAQELGYGQRIDELFSGTPSLMSMKMAIVHAAKGGRGIMVMDVKCAFLYGDCRRRIYIELPRQDPKHGAGDLVGRLQKAMYGTRDAPQIWAKEVQKAMEGLGFVISVLQPSVYHHPSKDLLVVVHVDDFLCSGGVKDLEWLFDNLSQKFELKRSMIMKDREEEVKYLGRTIRWTYDGSREGHFEVEGDERHAQLLMQEWSMQTCKDVDTPMTKAGQESINTGEDLNEDEARRARRAIARMNYMAQDRPDLSVAARVMSQYMSKPREGMVPVIKRAIRYLKRYPRCSLVVPSIVAENCEINVWSDSDWANDPTTRRSCSGGYIQVNGVTVGHWSKTQLNVALSSGEAELNASVKALSETIGLKLIMEETVSPLCVVPVSLHVDASACKGMLLRHGSGRVKHLATKQLWAQGAIEAYAVVVCKVPRCHNAADLLTHVVSHSELVSGLSAMGFCFPTP